MPRIFVYENLHIIDSTYTKILPPLQKLFNKIINFHQQFNKKKILNNYKMELQTKRNLMF